MKEVIPVPYQAILKRMSDESYENTIEICKVRFMLSHLFRMGKKRVSKILIEMKENGWIAYTNCSLVELKYDPKLL